MGRMRGKIALITGGASGLGKADAVTLVREGARVVITDVDEAAGRETADMLNAPNPGQVLFLKHDVASEGDWQDVLGKAQQHFGGLHVLVNNAGFVQAGNVEDTSLEIFRRHTSVMLDGVFLGCKHAIPLIKASGGGSIINVSSVAALLGFPMYIAYTAAKGAVRSMSKSVAAHCQANKYNIRCNSIHPGRIKTPLVHKTMRDQHRDEVAEARTPWGVGEPEDVANLVLFLACDDSRFINGTEIVIDNAYTVQ
jgi:3(or 17)beta-hydroxysteroid dehydrogenase